MSSKEYPAVIFVQIPTQIYHSGMLAGKAYPGEPKVVTYGVVPKRIAELQEAGYTMLDAWVVNLPRDGDDYVTQVRQQMWFKPEEPEYGERQTFLTSE